MLMVNQLADTLAAEWLPGDDGPYPNSTQDSADTFSRVVANWFSSATSLAIPVATAQANRGVLTALATVALAAQSPQAAGNILSIAVMLYLTGQAFGSGFSAPPLAQAAAGSLFGTAFSTLDLDRTTRAQIISLGIFLMTMTTLVSFPFPPFTAPVL